MKISQRMNGRALAVAVAVLLLTATFFLVRDGGDETRTVTASFPRAVSVYTGTDVRILGVNVGSVTAVIPDGESVRVEMEYDAKYDVPADAKAAIITPTLVADRFVQLTPAYTGGPVMKDGADIALPDTGVPVELDRIYASLRDLSAALGPNGANKDGTLDNLLRAGAENLDGEGALANEMIRNLSAATATFGKGSDDLFATVTELAEFTGALSKNDRLVRAFLRDLAGMSAALADERVELQRALGAVARSVNTVEGFVRDNREALVTDLEKLTRVMKTINSEKQSLDTVLQVGPLALSNLALAFNTKTGSIGSRVSVQGTTGNPDGLLCAIVQQSDMPEASKDLACEIFEQLLEPVVGQTPQQTSGQTAAKKDPRLSDLDPRSTSVQQEYANDGTATFEGLLGGGS